MQKDLCHIVAVAALVLLHGHNTIYENFGYIAYTGKLQLAVVFLKRHPALWICAVFSNSFSVNISAKTLCVRPSLLLCLITEYFGNKIFKYC